MELELIKLAKYYHANPAQEDAVFEKLALLLPAMRGISAAARWAAPHLQKLWGAAKAAGRQYNQVARGTLPFKSTRLGQWATGTGRYGPQEVGKRWTPRGVRSIMSDRGGLPGIGRNIQQRFKEDPLGTAMTGTMMYSMLPTGTASSSHASDYLEARDHVLHHMDMYKQASSEEDKKYHRIQALDALHFMGS